MHRRHIIAAGLSLALLWAAPAPGQEPVVPQPRGARARVVVVVMAEDLLENLSKLATRAKRETVRCLIGLVQGDTAHVEMALEPEIRESNASSVSYGGCPRATMAKWHNHLARFAPTPADACYLSDTDVADALMPGAPPLQIVQVNESVMCWWTRPQVAVARPGAFLWPIRSQFTAAPSQVVTRDPLQ